MLVSVPIDCTQGLSYYLANAKLDAHTKNCKNYPLSNWNGYDMRYIHIDGWITHPVWDINMDHNCSVGDLVSIGNHLNEYGDQYFIPEDINGDGSISVGDLVAIGNYWNSQW